MFSAAARDSTSLRLRVSDSPGADPLSKSAGCVNGGNCRRSAKEFVLRGIVFCLLGEEFRRFQAAKQPVSAIRARLRVALGRYVGLAVRKRVRKPRQLVAPVL